MARIGLTGLGTMGANLALNIAEKGFEIAVHNRTAEKIDIFLDAAGPLRDRLAGCPTLEVLVEAVEAPRTIILMVPAGDAVDSVIDALAPLLEAGDTIIDAGNADFNDTMRRGPALAERGLRFLGMGVSGGEDGARHGPSIMVGGEPEAYEPVRDVVEAIAARYQDAPCAALVGPDGAGHFVKTVHNGIEYGDMQLIADVYGILRDGDGRSAEKMAELFGAWNEGPLRSYLIEITATVLSATDPVTGGPAVDEILDKAGQKGTGRWTLIEALKLGQSASVIEAAVAARSWSAAKPAREAGAEAYPDIKEGVASPVLDGDLEKALLAGRIIAYGQGFALLEEASRNFSWNLDPARIAEIWRAGCIIRSALLDDIAQAAGDGLPHGQIMFAEPFRPALREGVPALRRVVSSAVAHGLPTPALSAALAQFETMRRARGTANLIQAQRDFFGAHGFDRVDGGPGRHGPWASGAEPDAVRAG